MERKKVLVSTDNYQDRITIFSFSSHYQFNTSRLTTVVRNETIGPHNRMTIKINEEPSHQGRYRVSFSHADDDNVGERIRIIMEVLEEVERKLIAALEMDAVKGLLKNESTV